MSETVKFPFTADDLLIAAIRAGGGRVTVDPEEIAKLNEEFVIGGDVLENGNVVLRIIAKEDLPPGALDD